MAGRHLNQQEVDAYYVKCVTELGDRAEIVTNQPIFTVNNIKLVEKGVRVTSALYDKLVQHKLMPALDHCLSIENAVDADEVARVAAEACDALAPYARLRAQVADARELDALLRGIVLPPPLAFKLTVARMQRPELFAHSVRTALVTLYLGLRAQAPRDLLASLAGAGLFHDIGVLHIDPALLVPDRKQSGESQRHLHAHPVTANLILQAFPEYHPFASTAVLEHHERLDGSGYPRGLREEQISPAGKVVMAADLAVTLLDKHVEENPLAARVAFQLSHRHQVPQLIAYLLPLFGDIGPDEEGANAPGRVIACSARLDTVSSVFDRWAALAEDVRKVRGRAGFEAVAGVAEWMEGLTRELADAGLLSGGVSCIVSGLEHGGRALCELEAMVDEAERQLRELIDLIRQRWGTALAGLPASGQFVQKWMDETIGLLDQH